MFIVVMNLEMFQFHDIIPHWLRWNVALHPLQSDLVQMMTDVSPLRLRNVVIKRIGTAIRLAPGRGSPVFRLKLPQWS